MSRSAVVRLRAAFVQAAWYSGMPLALFGTVLGMLDGQECSDPGYCEAWFRFRLMRRYLAYGGEELGRISRLLDLVGAGAPVHGTVHLLAHSASDIGFRWSLHDFGWFRPGLPCLPLVSGVFQHYKSAFLDAWRDLVSADLCCRKVSVVGLFWIVLFLCSY